MSKRKPEVAPIVGGIYSLTALQLKDVDKCQKVHDILAGLVLSDATIEHIKEVFKNEMELALDDKPSSLQMENTYIPELLDGTENGIFLAMDLGGTNLRVLDVELIDGQVSRETVKHYPLPEDLRIGCGTALFDYLAKCVKSFVTDANLREDIVYPMGFTFSFPMHQHALNSAKLVTWTKSFNCPSIVGVDVVEKLRESLTRCGCHNIEVLAILNDTTGTLMQGALLNQQTRIGIVLGTGTNGCYMENAERVKHWEQKRHGEKHVIIDVEWGAFGDNGVLDFIRTKFDRTVDESSLLRNSFTFEKYISGKYLGELCRVILKDLYDAKLFMLDLPSENFPKPWTFNTNNVSKIEEDTVHDCFDNTRVVFKEHFLTDKGISTDDDLYIARYVCGAISLRAAQLLAINTAMLLNRMDDEHDITVAIDGSVYKHHPRVRHWIDDYIKLWAPTKNVNFMLAEDGSGKGAALVAAIADKLRMRY